VKLGILGGSFNPVHIGHIFLADKAIVTLKLDRVVMIPAYRSPFKLDAQGMEDSAKYRLEMLTAAAAGDSRLAIDDCELKRQGVSYTIDTLEDVIRRYMPSGKPALIIGDDIAGDFLAWRDSKKILQLADIAVARRVNSAEEKYPFAHTVIDNEVMNVSSQTVRQRIKEGEDWRALVPAGVRAIIEDRRLYGFSGETETDEDCNLNTILRIEAEARETLSIGRFLHSRNTALLAHDLCRRFGLNPLAGYLAGIAHDLGKELDNKQQIKLANLDGMKITSLEREKPNLLHGRVAAVLLRERFNIHNKEVLEAVAVHTSGKRNMGLLAKIIYIADKAESSRNIDSELRRMCNEDDLDSIFYAVLKRTVSKLQARDLKVSAETLHFLDKLKEKSR